MAIFKAGFRGAHVFGLWAGKVVQVGMLPVMRGIMVAGVCRGALAQPACTWTQESGWLKTLRKSGRSFLKPHAGYWIG